MYRCDLLLARKQKESGKFLEKPASSAREGEYKVLPTSC